MSDAPTTNLIRRYCDGELPPPEAARLEAALRDDVELRARVDFERTLRERVGAAIETGCPPAPTDLGERVRTAIAAETTARPAGRVDPEPARHRAWWQGPQRANVFAVAASLALVGAAVLFGIFGRPIDSWQGTRGIDVGGEVAAAVAGEHVASVADFSLIDRMLVHRTPEAARENLAAFLGSAAVFDLRDLGYEFVGGSTCQVPHCERGCHLYYRRTGPEGGLVTVHVVPGRLAVRGDAPYRALPLTTDRFPENQACRKDVLVWNHDRHCFLLVVCRDDDVERVALRMQQTLLATSR